jgi:flagellar assembly factor FliW
MRVNTCRFGELEINPETVITLEEGLFGFARTKRYCLLEHTPESPFRWLQSVDQGDVAFVVIDPVQFFGDYVVEIADPDAEALALDSAEDAAIVNIVTIAENYLNTTVNLLAPVVINTRTRRAKQLILANEAYSTAHRLMGTGPAQIASARAAGDKTHRLDAKRTAAGHGE